MAISDTILNGIQRVSTSARKGGAEVTLATGVANGVMTAAATVAANTTYTTTSLDGANMGSGTGILSTPRNVTVTTTSNTGAYHTTLPITVTGSDWYTGETAVDSLYLTQANGNETITGNVVFSNSVALSIYVPAQHDTTGTIAIGVGNAVTIDPPCDALHVGVAGNVCCTFVNDTAGTRTTFTTTNNSEDRPWAIRSLHEGTTATGIIPLRWNS